MLYLQHVIVCCLVSYQMVQIQCVSVQLFILFCVISIGTRNKRKIHIPHPSSIEEPDVTPTQNHDEEDLNYDHLMVRTIPPQAVTEVRQLYTDSATPSHVDPLNRADGNRVWPAGVQSNNIHWRQKSGSSFSSGTASETTHDRYPMITPITATTVSQPQANSLSRIVHSDFESPKRETSVANLQHKPYSAINPLTNPSAGTQQLDCRNLPHSLRQSFKSGAPSSAMDLRFGGRQMVTPYQHCLETVSFHNSSNGEIQKFPSFSRQSSMAGTYHYSSSDV